MSVAKTFTDMMGREVVINFPPKRIVSLVPSQTELLFDLGLDEEVVGITKFCIHPEVWFREKVRVGGTKQVQYDKIAELKPDLIIANKEENTKEIVETLAKDYPVWISDIVDLNDAIKMIRSVGELVDRAADATLLAGEIINGFHSLKKAAVPKRVAYFIWRKPWMTIGSDTFINHMIETIGWENVFADHTRYPEITLEQLAAKNPELVLLSSEPYPFKEKHIDEIKAALPGVEVQLVDGEMFSWYGSRLKKAVAYMNELIV